MPTTTKPYGEELVSKGLAVVETAQHLALSYVDKGLETLRGFVPQAQDAINKVDVVDTKHAVDSAFDVASRVLASQRAFVGDILGTVFEAPEPAKPAAAKKAPAASA